MKIIKYIAIATALWFAQLYAIVILDIQFGINQGFIMYVIIVLQAVGIMLAAASYKQLQKLLGDE